MITEPKTERFRTIPPQQFLNFPEEINPLKLTVFAYDLGNKCKSLTVANFECITFIDWYNCQMTNRKFIKALGLLNKKTTVLWLSK